MKKYCIFIVFYHSDIIYYIVSDNVLADDNMHFRTVQVCMC